MAIWLDLFAFKILKLFDSAYPFKNLKSRGGTTGYFLTELSKEVYLSISPLFLNPSSFFILN